MPHGGGRGLWSKRLSAHYGELADDAPGRLLTDQVALTKPSEFRIIRKSTRRIDSPAKTNWIAKVSDRPGITVIAPPPVKVFDAQTARLMNGVRGVFEIPLVEGSTIAVVADLSAKQAREQLKIDWDFSVQRTRLLNKCAILLARHPVDVADFARKRTFFVQRVIETMLNHPNVVRDGEISAPRVTSGSPPVPQHWLALK
jgi:hypothetical protein